MAREVLEAESLVTPPKKPDPLTFDAGVLGAKTPVVHQTSAGGVVYKRDGAKVMVAIVSVGNPARWQLPKGLIEKSESAESAAMRETREEAGVSAEVESHLETIEYWYVGAHEGRKVRFHKRVHFYLLRYSSGDVADHDVEVNESRWVEIEGAQEMLAFASEKKVVRRAGEMLTITVDD